MTKNYEQSSEDTSIDDARRTLTDELKDIAKQSSQSDKNELAASPQKGALLPTGDELIELYEDSLLPILPTSARLAWGNEKHDLAIFEDPEDEIAFDSDIDLESVNKLYLEKVVKSAYSRSWWTSIKPYLKNYVSNPDDPNLIRIVSKHTLEVVVDGNETGQNFEIFELGEEQEDKACLDTVFKTLELLDQMSGGLLSSDPRRPKILLTNAKLTDKASGRPVGGLASEKSVMLSISNIYELADEHQADPQQLLATVLTHEILGHSLERLVHGKPGEYFKDYFDYSEARNKGKLYKDIHNQITPKDKNIQSEPMREYGYKNPSEDFATSVDTTIAEAMGWSRTTNKLDRFRGKVDSYRRDLVIKLMQAAAKNASKYEATAGDVATEIEYEYDNNGEAIAIKPKRKYIAETTPGTEAVRNELNKVLSMNKPPKQLVVDVSKGFM
jgi:hypothetical protein